MDSQSVFITGIHTGLGHALAEACMERNARVYAVSRTEPADLTTNPLLTFSALDLRRTAEIPGVIGGLLEGVETLDVVLLNAGVLGELKDLKDTSLEEIRAVMDINVWANKVVIDTLLGSGIKVSQVVAISSGAAFNGSGGWGAYSISKSALNLLIRVYANEHPETHFTALAPGVIRTNMIKYVVSRPDDSRYPANARIRRALEESRVMSPGLAAANVLARVPELLDRPSGAFVDIREM